MMRRPTSPTTTKPCLTNISENAQNLQVHNISLPRCAPLLLSIISFSVISSKCL